jgi:hypothetical protein
MIFNILYGMLSFIIIGLAGCQKVNQTTVSSVVVDSCSTAPMRKPLESCSQSLDSLQVQAKQTHLKSTELTPGEYGYSSGEILMDYVLKSGDHLRVHAKESLCRDEASGRMMPRMELICQESVTQNTATLEMSQFAPRTITIRRDERSADAAFRGVVMKTPGGTLSYRFEDSKIKMGMSRTDFQKVLNESFDESYFVRENTMTYQFIGKKKLSDGSTQTIRMTLKKTDGNFSKDALLFDPIPDSIFKI